MTDVLIDRTGCAIQRDDGGAKRIVSNLAPPRASAGRLLASAGRLLASAHPNLLDQFAEALIVGLHQPGISACRRASYIGERRAMR